MKLNNLEFLIDTAKDLNFKFDMPYYCSFTWDGTLWEIFTGKEKGYIRFRKDVIEIDETELESVRRILQHKFNQTQ